MGRLTGKYSKANPIPANRNFSKVSIDELEPLTEAMRRIGDKHSVSVSSVALNYVICKGMKSEESFLFFQIIFPFEGVIPLGGARDAKQAEENAGALGWRLTNDEITELESHHVTTTTSFFSRLWQHG